MKFLFTAIFITIGFTTTIIVPIDIEALASQKISYHNDQGRHTDSSLHHVLERNVDSNLTSEEIPKPITFKLIPDQFRNNTKKGSFKDSQPMRSYNTKISLEHSDWEELKSLKNILEDPSESVQTKDQEDKVQPFRRSYVVTLHENDLQVVQDFHQRLRVLLRKLLICAGVESLKVSKISEIQPELEALFRSLWSEFKQIIAFGNLFRSQIAHVFEKARSLFELLQYHESLELRYGDLLTNSAENQEKGTGYSLDEMMIGSFGLKLVKYELSLFLFLSDDGSFESGTVAYDEKLHNSEFQFQNLMQDYEKMIEADIPYSTMFEKEIERLTGMFHQMQHDLEVQQSFPKNSCSPKTSEKSEGNHNVLISQKSPQELTTKGTEDLLDMAEQTLNIMEDLLVKYNDTNKLDLDMYVSCKASVLQIMGKLERSIVPSQSQVKVEIMLSETSLKVRCMDQEIACGKLDSCFNQHYSPIICLSVSFMEYSSEIKALDHLVENLLNKISNWASSSENFDVDIHASEIKEAKFLLEALQSIDSTIWSGVPSLVNLRYLMKQISVNIRNSEAILSELERSSDLRLVEMGAVGSEFKDTKHQEENSCDETLAVIIEEELEEIEYALHEYSKPKIHNIDDLKKHIDANKTQFYDLMRNSGLIIISCFTKLITQAERISSLIQMLEEALQERQSERPQGGYQEQ